MSRRRTVLSRSGRGHNGVRFALIVVAALVLGMATAPVASATPAPTGGTAGAAPAKLGVSAASARARATGHAVVVTALTTPTSQTTANVDGSFTLTQSVAPARLERGDTWVNLDPTLHTNSDGTVSPNATTADVTLSGGGSGPLATMRGSAHQVSLTMPFPLPAPTLSGSTATYANVLPSVDLVVSVDAQGGVSDVLVVKTAEAAANPALEAVHVTTATEGLTVTSDGDDGLVFVDQAGQTIYSAAAPMMWDSAPTPAGITTTTDTGGQRIDSDSGLPVTSSPQAPAEQAHQARVAETVAAGTITLTPDPSLLTADTSFPVYIDPTITFHPDAFGGSADWTEVQSGFPNQPGWHRAGMEQVGDCDWAGCNGLGVARSMFQFSVGPLRGADIISAQFNVTEEFAPACTATGDVTMNLFITSAAINSGTNWNNQPGLIGSRIGSSAAMHGHDSTCPAAGVGFNVTSGVKADIGRTGNVIDFELRSDNELNKFGWKQLSHTATWSTTYDVKPVTPFNPKPSPAIPCTSTPTNAIIGKTDLVLSIQTGKASDGVVKPLNVQFQVTNTATGGIVSDHTIQTSAGSFATLSIPQGTFATGNYSWRAQASDGFLLSNWSTACAFRVDTTQPGTPTITPTAPAGCTVADCEVEIRTPITVTFNPAAGSTPTQYRYQLNSGLPVTVNATAGSWTGTITPRRIGPNVLTVQALSVVGTPSSLPAQLTITTDPPAQPDKDGDFTGDGHPDQVTVGNQNGTPPGLWLATGDGTGELAAPTDIGIRGTGRSTSRGAASDWNGAIVTPGQFTGDGMQDLLAVFPSDADHTQTAVIYAGTGDGSALDPQAGNGSTFDLQGFGCFLDADVNCVGNTTTMTRIAAVGQTPQDGCGTSCPDNFPDVFAIVDDNGSFQLWQYPSLNSGVGGYSIPIVLDSTTDWATKQISGVRVDGQAALEVRDTVTGEVDLYTTAADPDPNANWFTTATKTVLLTSGTAATSMTAVDADSDGNPDLWTTTSTGAVSFYRGVQPAGGTRSLQAPNPDGSLVPDPTHMTSFGAVTWNDPDTGTSRVDIYTADGNGNLWDSTETSAGQLGPRELAATGWTHYRSVGIADMNHDNYPDLVVFDTTTGDEDVFTGSATGLATNPTRLSTGWTGFTPFGVADWNHDGHVETIAVDDLANMWAYPGDLTGGLAARVQIGTGWTSALSPFGIADVNGDGHYDILTCIGGNTRLYLGDLTGGKNSDTPKTVVARSCQSQSFVGLTDYDGDGHPDLIVRDTATNNIVVNPGPGGLGSYSSLGTIIDDNTPDLTPFGAITWTDPTTAERRVDIYAADTSGVLWDYTQAPGNPLSTTPTQLATGWTHYRTAGVADMNHDGYPDLVVLDTDTAQRLVFTQTAAGLSTTPIVTGTDWTSDLFVYGQTDYLHTGHFGTLVVQASAHTLWFYPGDLTGGSGPRVAEGTGWFTWTPFGLADFTGDGNPDALTCRPDLNVLYEYPYPGTATDGLGDFYTAMTFCSGETPFGTTDYDDDGHPDLIVRDTATGHLIVDHGNGDRWFKANPSTIANGW